MNNAARDTVIRPNLSETLFSVSLGVNLEEELLGHRVILFLNFLGITIMLCTEVVSFYIPTNSALEFQCLYVHTNSITF